LESVRCAARITICNIPTHLYYLIRTAGERDPIYCEIQYIAGSVSVVDFYTSSDGKLCMAEIIPLQRSVGDTVDVLAPNETSCLLFVLSKIGKTKVILDVERVKTVTPPTLRKIFPIEEGLPLYSAKQVEIQ
jgi:hypothetical protein